MTVELGPVQKEFTNFLENHPRVKAAYEHACILHKDQTRLSGEPFIVHPKAVAEIILFEWRISDEDLIIAALLHDGLEDTSLSEQEMIQIYSEDINTLVMGVSKLKADRDVKGNAGEFKRIFEKSYLDPRVGILKLADRLHNMRTLASMSSEKQVEKSTETLQMYAKLAESLGMWRVKVELEDLSFKYIQPQEFNSVKATIDSDPRRNDAYVAYMESYLLQLLHDSGISCSVQMSKGGYYELYNKQLRYAFEGRGGYQEINDVDSFRIIVNSISDCYKALGIVHGNIESINASRFDEYIAKPRVNGYSAIQTTLDSNIGAVEIAIATSEMESFNDWGVLSRYGKDNDISSYSLKLILTPSGVWFLNKSATGLDLAINQRPVLGPYVKYVLVDGVQTPSSVVLPNASNVSIVWEEPHQLDNSAKHFLLPQSIKPYKDAIHRESRNAHIKIGKEIISQCVQKYGFLSFDDLLVVRPELKNRIQDILPNVADSRTNSLYYSLGIGLLQSSELADWLKRNEVTPESGYSTIEVSGEDRTGVLASITSEILAHGGNVEYSIHIPKGGKFRIRFVVTGLDQNTKKILEKYLSAEQYETCIVI
jgi:(p)ppGpp synthase/HD superfamily hydrolase